MGRRRDRQPARRSDTVVSATMFERVQGELEVLEATARRQSERILHLNAELQAARRYPAAAYGDLTAAIKLVEYIETRVGERTPIVELLKGTLAEIREAATLALRPPVGTGFLDEDGLEITVVEGQ